MMQILQALLTPMIGIVALYVAWRQYRITKQKHEIEIFNRRMDVYKQTVKFLIKVHVDFEVSENDYYEWAMKISEAEFLFGREIIDLLEDIDDKATTIIQNQKDNVPLPITEEYEQVTYSPDEAEVFNEFLSFRGRASELFAPYFQTFLKLKKLQGRARYKEMLEEEGIEIEKLNEKYKAISAETEINF